MEIPGKILILDRGTYDTFVLCKPAFLLFLMTCLSNSGAAAFTEGSQTTYPPNTVLLSTRMRYGVISYNSDDVETWRDDKKWRPSSVEARRVAQEWQSIPTAQIKLVTDKNGVVQVSIRDETTLADRVWSICSIS